MSGNFLQPSNVAVTSSASATGNPRNKVALKKGYGLLDWVKLGNSSVDLAGTKGKIIDVTPQELAKHNKKSDAWMALKGRVYNVTPYMNFHPGGEDELMRGAGIDATHLFNEVHKWVNFESMLQKCLVGRYVETKSIFPKPNFLPLIKLVKGTTEIARKGPTEDEEAKSSEKSNSSLEVPNSQSKTSTSNSPPVLTPLTPTQLPAPKYDWFQTNTLVNIAIYTKWKQISRDRVIIFRNEQTIRILTYIQTSVYVIHLELQHPVKEGFVLKVGSSGGKVDVLLTKEETGKRWTNVGRTLEGNNSHIQLADVDIEYITCKLIEKREVTHDTKMFVLQCPEHVHMSVPVGLHVFLRLSNTDIIKPYTPVLSSLTLDKSKEEEGRLLHLLIKIYSDGEFTKSLDKTEVGSDIDVSMPQGSFNPDIIAPVTQLCLLGAGTGVTPLVKLLINSLPDKKKVTLILFNKTENDIPWKDELKDLQSAHSDYLTVHHVLSNADDAWSGYKGRVNKELLEELIPPLSSEEIIFSCFCGPTPFTKSCVQLLQDLNHPKDHSHAFLG